MNSIRMLARHRLAGAAILAGVLAAACVPIRQEASWPALSLIGDDQNIVIAYNDRVVMVDPDDGTPVKLRNADGEIRVDEEGRPRVWQFTGPEGTMTQFYSSPVELSTDKLLIASYNERLFEVGLATARADGDVDGEEVQGQIIANPVIADDLLYVGFGERDLVALGRDDRLERWRVETSQGVWSEPLIIDDVLYFTSLDHFLYAVDPVNGDLIWKLDLGGAAAEAPVYHEGRLYIGSFARKIFEISTDGEILSEYATDDWVWSTPRIVDGVLYAGDLSGMVYAIDIGDGGLNPIWQAKASDRAVRTTPLVANEYVIVGSRDQKVYWLSREDGSTFFSREVGGEVLSGPLLIEPGDTDDTAESLVVVGTPTHDELLVAFGMQNGERVWTYPNE